MPLVAVDDDYDASGRYVPPGAAEWQTPEWQKGAPERMRAYAAKLHGEDDRKSPFINLSDLDDSDPIVASVGRREDGAGLLYASAVNGLIGDPEQGKSLAAAALAVQVLSDPKASVVWLDLDHNGPRAFRKRVEALGLSRDALARVSFAQAEDRDDVMHVVRFVVEAGEDVKLFVVDSLGELLPIFGASSDSADDYTRVHREVLTRAASAGAAVLTIDHLAKGSESRAYGGTGTIAKKRAVDGALYRVEASKPFAPGAGGTAGLRLLKDRHGSVRASLPDGAGGSKEPVVTRFEMTASGGWVFSAPGPVTTAAQLSSARLDVDVDLISKMSPPPTGYRDVQDRLKFGSDRARAALKAWKERTSGAPE